jgi:hypothetical protein
MRLPLVLTSLTAMAGLAAFAAPRDARACGGTFCDAGPTAMPVDQTGENILFVLDGPSVEAHIQIQYDPRTSAEEFAWVIPVQAIPEFEIGSDPLFQALLAGTVPSYGLTFTNACMDPDPFEPPPNGGDEGGIGFIDTPDGGSTSVEVVLEETVGALDIVVLSGGTVDEVITWLEDNGYQQDPAAEPILAEYLAEGWMFAAIKLANATGVDEIHPLVMRYESGEACVPLKLTRIAAQDDMEVRTFFLGDDRVAPTNYDHVLVNPLKLDWLNQADNYKEVITLAVDGADANGKAFVTEYAGASDVVNTFGIYDEAWSPEAFVSMPAEDVIDTLNGWGLTQCAPEWGGCATTHPLVLPLLRAHLPAPEGTSEADFWSCVSCWTERFGPVPFDGAAFGAELDERIVQPGLHAIDLLSTWPYLTRMYTTISPQEMTVDPMFHGHPNLPEVDNRNQFADQATFCTGDSAVTLPDGREVYLPAGSAWPEFSDEMPWVEDTEEMPIGGMPPIPLIDNTAQIDQILADWNRSHDWPPSGGGGEGDDTAGDGTAGGTDGSGTGGGTGGATDGPGADGGMGGSEEAFGCACSGGGGSPLGAVWMILGMALARLRRNAWRHPRT